MTPHTQQRTFLYMKLAAVILITAVLALLYIQSNRQEALVASGDRSFISDLGPVEARPPSPITGFLIYDFTTGKSTIKPLVDFRQQVLHVIFWASWCEPCQTELPVLEKLIQSESSLYKVLLINVDSDEEGRKKAMSMHKLLIPSAMAVFDGSADLEKKMNVEALPLHVLIDTEGRTATVFYNSIDERKKLEQFKSLLHQLLAEVKPVASSR